MEPPFHGDHRHAVQCAADELSLGALRSQPVGIRRRATLDAVADTPAYIPGRIAGAVLPAIASGGESLLGRAALGLGTGAGLGELAAGAVARSAAGSLTRRGMGEAAAGVIGRSLGGAVDASLGAVQGAITDANISDEPIDGERVMGDALFGTLFSFGLHGTAGALRRGTMPSTNPRMARDIDTLVDRGIAVQDDMPLARQIGETEINPNLPTEDQGFMARFLSRSPVFTDENMARGFRQVMANPAMAFARTAFTEATGVMNRRLTALAHSASELMEPLTNARLRHGLIQRGVREGVESGLSARNVLIGTRDLVTQNAGFLAERGGTAVANRWGEALDDLIGAGEDAVPRTNAELVTAIDDMMVSMRRAPDTVAAQELYGQIQDGLRRSGNHLSDGFSSAHEALRLNRAATNDMARFGTVSETGGFRFEPSKLARNFQTSIFRTGTEDLGLLSTWMRSLDDTLETVGTHGTDTAAARLEIAAMAGELEELATWGHLVSTADSLGNIERAGGGIQAAVGHGGVAFLAGAITGSPIVGAAAGLANLAVAGFGHPVGLLRITQGVRRSIDGGAARVASGTARIRSSFVSPRTVAASVAEGIGKGRLPVVVQRLRSPETREEEYNTIVDQVREYAGDPESMMSRVGDMTANMGRVVPNTADAMAGAMVRGVYYLADRLPPPEPPSPFPTPPRRPSVSEMEDIIRSYEAIEDPYSILDRTADGSLTAAHVDAVAAVYPMVYDEMRAAVLEMMGGLTKAPPYQARIRTGLLLGVDADPSLDDRFIFAMQRTYSQTTEQNQAQAGQGSVTLQTRISDDTMSRAASVTHRL